MSRREEWFNDRSFWEIYAPIMFDDKRWGEVGRVADGITRLGRLNLYGEGPQTPGPLLADLCCGFGRITLEMARRGFHALGVDITDTYLEAAREDAAYENLEVEFIKADVRDFKRPLAFDLAVNLYISFGYFDDPAEDLLFARNAYASLKPGGRFIIETLGKEMAVRDFVESEWFERAGYMVLTEYESLDSWSALRNRWILVKEGEIIERVFSQRLYAASELRRLLLDAGFSRVELYGNWEEAPYDIRAESLIAVAEK